MRKISRYAALAVRAISVWFYLNFSAGGLPKQLAPRSGQSSSIDDVIINDQKDPRRWTWGLTPLDFGLKSQNFEHEVRRTS